jgi:K+-sensing histidine kinase KdpD
VRELAVLYRAARQDLGVVVQIADTGKGLRRAGPCCSCLHTTRPRHGTGLGLSISRSIVQAHGATIEASGLPGRGATFTLRFPAAEEENGTVRE